MNYRGFDKINVIDAPIKDLLNKIIIINTTRNNDGLENILDDNSKIINNSTDDVLNYTKDSMRRVYLNESILSMMSNNFDPMPYFDKRTNMVALNFNSFDPYLYKNLKMFEEYSFKHFLE